MATRAGLNPNFSFKGMSQKATQIVHAFSRHFYVTRPIPDIQIGNSTYCAFLMRPSDDFSIYLNSEREIMVVVSEYESFEARSIDVFDRIIEMLDDSRIDKTVRFLVSDDRKINDSISLFLQKDPEYPVIIPFYSENLLEGWTRSNIVQTIRNNYTVRDLFGFQAALKQDYFYFGRGELVSRIIDAHHSKQNSSIFGLRKSGKTSTINAIRRRAKGANLFTVSFDCEDTAIHAKNYAQLLFHIVSEIREAANLRSLKHTYDPDAPDQVSERFREDMLSVLSAIKKNTLIIFDEIENISPNTAASPHWTTGRDTLFFWQILRSFFQSDTRYYVSFCFVGTNPSLFETPRLGEVANPVYLFAPRTFLSGLSLDDTREMCQKLGFFMGIDFGDAIVAKIHQAFGGHPFFVRQVCSEIHKALPSQRPVSVSSRVFDDARKRVRPTIRGYIDDIFQVLNKFYPDEYEMLSYLANGRESDFDDMARDYPELIEHALGYGILVEHAGQYELHFDEIGDALRRNKVSDPTLEEMRTEIMRRRSAVEESLREQLFFWSQRTIPEEVISALDLSLGSKRIEKLSSLDPRALFAKRNSPLYVLDLLHIIENTDIVRDPNDIPKFKKAVEIINSNRIDAHAKGISRETYEEVSRALGFLEDNFLPPV